MSSRPLRDTTKIAGIIYPSAFQVTELVTMMGSTFRSPSDFDYLRHKNLELGVWNADLATNERKTIWALIDGTINNAPELREELKQKHGLSFIQETDAELIVNAYDAWGDKFLKHLNGPFALALFDEEKEVLLIARDRLGQKPLYWASKGEYWLFSTDVKGLISTGVIPQTTSNQALASYLYFGFIPQDLSAVREVNKILPGHFLKVDLGRQILIGQYWSLSEHFEQQKDLSSEEVYHRFGELLEESVRTALPKEGKIGALLSGNLGSSSLAWFLTHVVHRDRIGSYSAIFQEPHCKELEIATELAKMLNASHAVKQIQPEEVLEQLPSIVWHLDEPLADPYIVQTWHFAKLASSECNSVLADLGWEEMLAGHARYFAAKETSYPKPSLAFYLAKLPLGLLNHLVIPFFRFFHPDYTYKILRNIDLNREQVAYLMESALFKGKSRKNVSPFLFQSFDSEVFTQRFHRFSSAPGSINPSLYYDAKTELPDSLLLQYDRLMASHGLRVVAPFLDHRLAEFLATVPDAIKFESNTPGILLHNLMERLCHTCPSFPPRDDSFLEVWRKAPGFRQVFSELQRGRLVEEGLISGKWIKQKLSYPDLIPRTFRQLWSILILEIWFRLNINRPIDSALSELSALELLQQ